MRTILTMLMLVVVGGLFLGVPCVFLHRLSGGYDDPSQISLLFIFWPIGVIVAFITLCIESAFWKNMQGHANARLRRVSFWVPGPLTLWWLTFYFLPIIMNGLSKLLSIMGLEDGATVMFRWCWATQPLFLFASVAIVYILFVTPPHRDQSKTMVTLA